jgi:hypothetical protein
MPNRHTITFAFDADTGDWELFADVDEQAHFLALAKAAHEAIGLYIESWKQDHAHAAD